MRRLLILAVVLGVLPRVGLAAGPTALFTLPSTNTTPAVFGALLAFGGTQGGTRQNVITFTTPQSAAECAALGSVQVPLRGSRPGHKNIRGRALLGDGARDVDRLRLGCQPAS